MMGAHMCDVIGLSIGMAVLGGIGQLADASMQADTERRNAARAEDNAKEVKVMGAIDAYDYKQESLKALGVQISGMAGAGVDLGGESAIDAAFNSRRAIEKDSLKMQLGTDIDAGNYKFEAEQRKQNASNIMLRGFVGATSTFLSAGTKWGALK